MKNYLKVGAFVVAGFFATASVASAQFVAATANTVLATLIDDIEIVLSASLPVILAVVAALIGLGMLIRYIKRWIGRK